MRGFQLDEIAYFSSGCNLLDIVADLISNNIKKYEDSQHRFILADLAADPLKVILFYAEIAYYISVTMIFFRF